MRQNTQPPIIDLRSSEAYIQGHLPKAVNVPISQLPELWHELPPKGSLVRLCVNDEIEDEAIALFTARNFEIVDVVRESDLVQSKLSTQDETLRLWHGNPLLEQHHELLLPSNTSSDHSSSTPVAIDIGCGSGRDCILLGLLGYKVIAIDVYHSALERAQHSAKRWKVNIETVEMDCRKHPEQLIQLIERQQPALIMQSRFLHRPLFDIYNEHLPTGCKIAVHTFFEGAAAISSPKNPDFLLKSGELSERFQDWSVLMDRVHTLDDGRPLSLFVAEKVEG